MKNILKKLIGNKGCRFWYCRRTVKGHLNISINGTSVGTLPYCEYHGKIAREVAKEMNINPLKES